MRKIFITFLIFTFTSTQGQDLLLMGKIPEFLVNSPKDSLVKVFQNKNFMRFSATIDRMWVISYENSRWDQVGTIEDIFSQVSMFKFHLEKAISETPEVSIEEWADYTERSEVYPCGLVAIFRNNYLTAVWLDLK